MAPAPLLVLDIDAAQVTAHVEFNGVVFEDGPIPERVHRAIRLNGWTTSGPNRLIARVSAPTPGGSPRFNLKLREIDAGGQANVLADVAWPTADQPVTVGAVSVIDRAFALPGFGDWSWVRATPIPRLGPAELSDVAGLLLSLRQALADREPGKVIELQAIQIREQSLSVGGDPGAAEGRYRILLEQRMSAAEWRVDPVDRGGLRASTMAGGRLHHITDARGDPPVVAHGDGSILAIDPYVAKLAGRWSIVR